MPALACLNGEIGPVEEARVSVWDRGFLFGDSVYEVFRVYNGRLWLEQQHLDRLKRSLGEVEFPEVHFSRLNERIANTLKASEVSEGTVYIQITRGVAPRAHPFPKPPVAPTELIIVRPYDDSTVAKLRVTGVTASSQPDRRWGRCDIKSTNLLANVIALEHAQRVGAFEAILVDEAGIVTEATHSSLLWVRSGHLYGTPEGFGILPGTKRHLIEGLASKLGIPFSAEQISLLELLAQDEILLSGTTIEILPVISVDGQPVQAGTPGPIATQLIAAYRSAVDSWLST